MASSRKKRPHLTAPVDIIPERSGVDIIPERSGVEAYYDQALADLGITVPVSACRLVGNRLEFHLYGGQVLHWPVQDDDEGPATMQEDYNPRPEEEEEGQC
jgi:hypothetical protein